MHVISADPALCKCSCINSFLWKLCTWFKKLPAADLLSLDSIAVISWAQQVVGLGLAVVLACILVPVSAFLLFHTLGDNTTTWKTWCSGDRSSELEPRTVLASGHPLPFSELHAKNCNTDETSSHSFFSCSELYLQVGCQPLFHTCLQRCGSGRRQRSRNTRLGLAQRLTRPLRCTLAPRPTGHCCAALCLSGAWMETKHCSSTSKKQESTDWTVI